MMMAVVVVAAELLFPEPVPPPPPDVVPEECVDAAVAVLILVALLMPLPLATDESWCGPPAADCCPDPDCWPDSAPLPVRSSFMARLASSVSVAAAVVVVLDSGEVGEVVVELGDFSEAAAIVGMSRSMDFWLTALCDSVERLSQICLVGSISIIETMVCPVAGRGGGYFPGACRE